MAGNLLCVEPVAQQGPELEDSALLAPAEEAAAASGQRRSWRWARPAVATIGLACAAAAAVACLGARGHVAELWQGASLQGKQFLAMAPPGRLAVSPDCTMGPLPTLWGEGGSEPLRLKVLSYNLFWWSLFDKGQPGQLHYHVQTSGNGATRMMQDFSKEDPYDVMGFQECEDEAWLMRHSGLADDYAIFRDRACCMAYRKANWQLLAKGVGYVAEDPKYGNRPAQWMRLKNMQTGAVVFFLNHHGPIPINSGGKCGAEAVGYNILQVIAANAKPGDAIVAVGDFNANDGSATVQTIEKRLHKVFGGKVDGGIDHIFTSLGPDAVVSTNNLGSGGSDHEALSTVLERGNPPPVAGTAVHLPSMSSRAASVFQSLRDQVSWMRK